MTRISAKGNNGCFPKGDRSAIINHSCQPGVPERPGQPDFVPLSLKGPGWPIVPEF